MHRKKLLVLLEHYREHYPEEADSADRFIDFIEHNADCFQRSLLTGHITGSALVVDRSGTRVLLTHHRKMNRWLQLGGHTDGEPDVLNAALREAEEESGLAGLKPLSEHIFDIDIHTIPAADREPAHLHYDVRFLIMAAGSEDYTVSEESRDLAWVSIDKLADYTTEESMHRMARKWKKRRGREA